MKITGKNPFINLDPYIKDAQAKKNEASSSPQTSKEMTGEDKVVLSERMKEIQRAKKALGSIPDIREEKVAQVKKEIENGTYQVDGKKIALKMIKESLLNEVL